MRWLIGLVAVAAIGAAGYFFLHSRDDAKHVDAPREQVSNTTITRPTTTTTPPPAVADVSEQQEQGERKVIEDAATELALTTPESDKLIAALKVMQDGRRQLFADLKAKKLSIEDLSRRLRELRTAMNQSFEKDLGKQRSDQLIERMRIAHGGEPTSAK